MAQHVETKKAENDCCDFCHTSVGEGGKPNAIEAQRPERNDIEIRQEGKERPAELLKTEDISKAYCKSVCGI